MPFFFKCMGGCEAHGAFKCARVSEVVVVEQYIICLVYSELGCPRLGKKCLFVDYELKTNSVIAGKTSSSQQCVGAELV